MNESQLNETRTNNNKILTNNNKILTNNNKILNREIKSRTNKKVMYTSR